jgi:hypothetical protein
MLEKTVVPKNRIVEVVFAGRIAEVERSMRLGGVLFFIMFFDELGAIGLSTKI